MKRASPPRAATWLLSNCVRNEALVGDLSEQYRDGRSCLWYWRQVLNASMLEVSLGIRNRKLLALRLAVTGLVTLRVLYFLTDSANRLVMDWVQDQLHQALTRTDGTWASDAAGRFMVWFAVYLRGLPGLCAVYVICGWALSRLHRSSGIAPLFAFVLLDLAWRIGWVAAMWGRWRLQWEPYPGILILSVLTTVTLPTLAFLLGARLACGTVIGTTRPGLHES